MMIAERIQTLIHKLEVGAGCALAADSCRWRVAVFGLAVWYDMHAYRNFDAPEAMDAAQVARNLSRGQGLSRRDFIRPFSVYLVQKHNHALQAPAQMPTTNATLRRSTARIPTWPMRRCIRSCWRA